MTATSKKKCTSPPAMGDGTEFDDEDDDGELNGEEDPKPIMYLVRGDARDKDRKGTADRIWQLVDEVFDPNPLRSQVITLHLYIEYWLDKLLVALNITGDLMFAGKVKRLKDAGALDEITHCNIVTVNRLRNVYAHELDLAKVERKLKELLGELKMESNFESTDKDLFRSVCFQTMFTLDATVSNGGKPPGLEPYPHEEVRRKLVSEGKLHWQQCEVTAFERHGYIENFSLRCPLCQQGSIRREKDNTPGHRDSTMWPCEVCGLHGDGSLLDLETVKSEYR